MRVYSSENSSLPWINGQQWLGLVFSQNIRTYFGSKAVEGATYSFTVPPHLRDYMLHPKTPLGGAKVTETRDTELQQKYNNTQTHLNTMLLRNTSNM